MNKLEVNPNVPNKQNIVPEKSIFKSILLSLPMLLLLLIMTTGGQIPQDPLLAVASGITIVFLFTIFFLMIYTEKTYKYRSILFVIVSVCFVIAFITNLLEVRGSIILTKEMEISGGAPFCHMVIPMTIIPAVLTKTIIFPGSLIGGFASIVSMLVIWLGASLALGRGWCSWTCFYGGMDEGFSKLNKKPRIKIDKRWTYLPFAVLIGIVLTSAAALYPTYCVWLCPFKAVTEFSEIVSFEVILQTIIFVMLFLTLVIILPILTGKRTQCSLFCPFGAFQSFTNKINIFEIRIDMEKCISCGKCVKVCPTLSIDEGSIKKGRPLITCTKCARCIDECPRQAISYHIKGTKCGIRPILHRNLFIYPAFLFVSTFMGGCITVTLWRVFKLVTTGSVF